MSTERITPASPREKKVLFFSALLALILFALDQGTKLWVERSFQLYESRPLIDGYLSFTSVRNLGAAWSIFSGYGWLLCIFSVAVAVAVVIFFRKLAEGYIERYFALAVLLAGICGNALDRGFRGCVVDFIDVHYYTLWQYPVFNVADMAICCGMGLYILSSLLRKTPKKDEQK